MAAHGERRPLPPPPPVRHIARTPGCRQNRPFSSPLALQIANCALIANSTWAPPTHPEPRCAPASRPVPRSCHVRPQRGGTVNNIASGLAVARIRPSPSAWKHGASSATQVGSLTASMRSAPGHGTTPSPKCDVAGVGEADRCIVDEPVPPQWPARSTATTKQPGPGHHPTRTGADGAHRALRAWRRPCISNRLVM